MSHTGGKYILLLLLLHIFIAGNEGIPVTVGNGLILGQQFISCASVTFNNLVYNVPSIPGDEVILGSSVPDNITIDFDTTPWAATTAITIESTGSDLSIIAGSFSSQISVDQQCLTNTNQVIYIQLNAMAGTTNINLILNLETGESLFHSYAGYSHLWNIQNIDLSTGFYISGSIDLIDAIGCNQPSCAGVCPDCNNIVIDFGYYIPKQCSLITYDTIEDCGICGNICFEEQHSTPICSYGSCDIICDPGFEDCDNILENGCEINIDNDLNHCGSCNGDCGILVGVGNSFCSDGVCQVQCFDEYGDCDGYALNGCETPLNTITDCGSCSNQCIANNTLASCLNSECGFLCLSPYADCNGNIADGCEVDLYNDQQNCGECNSSCGITTCSLGICQEILCSYGTANCGNGCIDITSDTQNCGGCGIICPYFNNTIATCNNQECGIICDTPYIDCNGLKNDGCEVNPEIDTLNCGSCGNFCPNCVSGQCMTVTCALDLQLCGNDCVDLSNDPLNCGYCGNQCNTINNTPACVNGVCEIETCDLGFADCNHIQSDGCEASLGTVENCGQCGENCQFPNAITACEFGTCQVMGCSPGFGDCDGYSGSGCETNLNTLSNCGECGVQCSFPHALSNCAYGFCELISCDYPFSNCNLSILDGCEVNTNIDTNNCGECFNACAMGTTCAGGICEVNICPGNLVDCYGYGCTVDITTDSQNCGGCENACQLQHAISQCAGGSCTISSCLSGFYDCNGIDSDGCEQPIDLYNCGECGVECNLKNALTDCAEGTCFLQECNPMYANCNGVIDDGCETYLDTLDNCGACHQECTLPNTVTECVGGICEILSCSIGYGDCSSSPGCESDLNTLYNCGACSQPCLSVPNALTGCADYTCKSVCVDGYGDCNGNTGDGCETNFASNVLNCGICGSDCNSQIQNANPACTEGVCDYTECKLGYFDCDSNTHNGCETKSSETNCAGCLDTCAAVSNSVVSCDNSACVILLCVGTFQDCDKVYSNGCEIDVSSDLLNCGNCGTPCSIIDSPFSTSGFVCSNGGCDFINCNDGYADCDEIPGDGCEIDITNSPLNCGSCYNDCSEYILNADPICSGGICGYANCNLGFSDCDNDRSNGCETNIYSNIANCGVCGATCFVANGSPECYQGGCQIYTCPDPYADCDGDYNSGCEVNLEIDPHNCGTCAIICGPNASCNSNSCKCDPNFLNCNNDFSDGCEVNSMVDANNCGVCGSTCISSGIGVPYCSGGICLSNNMCPESSVDCDFNGSCETNIFSDENNCGGCNIVCGLNMHCSSFACYCDANFADCDTNSVNGCETSLTSTSNCGLCWNQCSLPNAISECPYGFCAVESCAQGFGNCDAINENGCEILIDSDSRNCGACGTVCPEHTFCQNGDCVCANSFADCNLVPSDGCETNLLFSDTNCGFCYNNCALNNSFPYCDNGICKTNCVYPYKNCDVITENGCEANLLNDINNCGNCNFACNFPNSKSFCENGECNLICNPGYIDCDKNIINGCEIDQQNDISNCGGCGNICSSENGVPKCEVGVCSTKCAVGYGDCDKDSANGCESNFKSDLDNCGLCYNICELNSICSNGYCTCNNNYIDCDGVAGCEVDSSTDIHNCGNCRNFCSLPQATSTCKSGSCSIYKCNAGFGDCDQIDFNGCEVDLSTSNTNCGSCGNYCPFNSQCVSGTCKCNSNFGDCDGKISNGCETSLTTISDCGNCGNQCRIFNGNSICSFGSCAFSSCDRNYQDCDKNQENGCEVNLSSDSANCGSCGYQCEPNSLCSNSICNCVSNFKNCDNLLGNGCEVDITTDLFNCGDCDVSCDFPFANSICSSGKCFINSCNNGRGDCDGETTNGCETDLINSKDNCGSCKNQCGDNSACLSGICTCKNSFADCDGKSNNGCEADLETSQINCGTCGNNCPIGTICTEGTCNCDLNFADCDELSSNGCEVNLSTDPKNCGGCNNNCLENSSAIVSCTSSKCEYTPCDPLTANCDLNSSTGCELSLNSNQNCGECGNICEFPHSQSICSNQKCVIVDCEEGYEDADDIISNGCEFVIYNPIYIAPPSDNNDNNTSNNNNNNTNTNNNNNNINNNIVNNNIPPSISIDGGNIMTNTVQLSADSSEIGYVPIQLTSSDQPVGIIQIPTNVISGSDQVTLVTSTIDISSTSIIQNNNVNSAVVSILLYDANGNEIHNLDSEITICLTPMGENSNPCDMCLGFEEIKDGKSKWVCQSDLSTTQSGSNQYYCGVSNHCLIFLLNLLSHTSL